MGDGSDSELVLPPRVDGDEALERFRVHMTAGLFRPPSLQDADWHPPKLLLVPARLVSARATSNWTAESGTRSGKKITWAPISGQHQDVHEGIAFLVSARWRRHEKRLLAPLDRASLTRQRPEGATLAETTMGDEDIAHRARELVQEAEKAACKDMIPGTAKRRLQVNTTIEDLTIEPLLLPVWEVEVDHGGTVLTGWVNAATGRVHANKVTSYKRVAAVAGALLGLFGAVLLAMFVMSALSGQAMLAAAEAERLEQERIAAEELRVLEEEWAASKEELTGAVAAGEEALAEREPGDARAAVSPVADTLERLHERVEEPELDTLWDRYQELDVEIDRIGAIRRGIEATKAVVNDAEKCKTALEIQTAWEDLKTVGPDEPERREAARLTRSLERCRAKTERELTAGLEKVMRDQRVAMGPKLERTFLDDGFDVRVSVQGSNKDRLKMTWVLFGRSTVHQITDGGSMSPGSFLRNLRDAGFRKVTFSDGFDESIWYDLEPESLDDGAKEVLAEMGLGEPLELPE